MKKYTDFIQEIRTALQDGDIKTAQQLSLTAATHYPENREIKKLVYLVAPPMVVLGNPSPEQRRAYRAWLQENHLKYRGQWVALSENKLIAHAGSSDELKEQVGDRNRNDVVMISIG